MYYRISMHPHACPLHLRVIQHFVYIQYGCGMQSMGVFSLNHDTTTSFRLGHTQFHLKFTPTCTHFTAVRMHSHAHSQHLKVIKHFVYIQYGCGMQLMGVWSLNNDAITSYRLGHTSFPLKFTPICTHITAMKTTICPSTASQGAQTLCISNMDVGYSQWGFQP
jgi:hypothetical protein